jgi:hypothetical protein
MHIGELDDGPLLDNDNGGDGDDESGVSSLMTSQTKKKSKKKSKSNLPTYSWEAAGSESNDPSSNTRTSQERIFTADHGSFLPSTTPGLYMAEEGGEEGEGEGEGSSVWGGGGGSEQLGTEQSLSGYPASHLDIQVGSRSRVRKGVE